MQISISKDKSIYKFLDVNISSIEIDNKVYKRMKELSKTACVNGFRKGHVPIAIIKSRFQIKLRSEIISEMMPSVYSKIIKEHKLNPIDIKLNFKKNIEGKPLIFDMEVINYPIVKFCLDKCKKIIIEKFIVLITKEDIEKVVHQIKKHSFNWVDVEKNVQIDDHINLNYSCSIDNKNIESYSSNKKNIIIGKNNVLSKDFDDALLGLANNETKTFNIILDDKTLNFKISINSIKRKKYTVLDDNFFKNNGLKGGYDKFLSNISNNMHQETDIFLNNKIKNQVFNNLIKLFDFHVPKILIDKEYSRLYKENNKLKKDDILNNAIYSVKIGLILKQISSDCNIKTTDNDIDKFISNISKSEEDYINLINNIKLDKERINIIKSNIIEDKIIRLIIDNAQIKKIKKGYFELFSR